MIEESDESDPQIQGRERALKQRAVEILALLPQLPQEMATALQSIEGAGKLADFIAGLMDIAPKRSRRSSRRSTSRRASTRCSTSSPSASRC
jgi:ATP-dependent Lon protease